MDNLDVRLRIKNAVIKAGSHMSDGLYSRYEQILAEENNIQRRWVIENILENAKVAKVKQTPICDDTGIVHVYIKIGRNRVLSGKFIDEIYIGIEDGLRALPARPMALKGDNKERIEQTAGIYDDPGALKPAPFILEYVDDYETLEVSVLMLGGGPEIRGKTYRVFHKHDIEEVKNELINWSQEAVALLGCTPATLAIGIGRTHYEATALMLQAQIDGKHEIQSELEKEITHQVNKSNVGALGLGGKNSVLATFVKIGEQRASGVRIVSMRPCCCVEPRVATVNF